jgi:hypothetical protein
MNLHVLPGDATVAQFNDSGVDGSVAVCRECLVEGPVAGETRGELFRERAEFIRAAYDGDDYAANVAAEFEKLLALRAGDEVNLWFEYELFCQVNYWFCLSLLEGTGAKVFRVSPILRDQSDKWKGFGQLSSRDMATCFAARVELSAEDIRRGAKLWDAFRFGRADEMRELAVTDSGAFPMLSETVEAAIARDERPREILREIIGEGVAGFENVFREFSQRAGVYGYGDSQVRRLVETL